ncbi:hypothetical protein G7Y89_g14053 [Cudoniella acicularis]|uniref:C2H2-type domain-containing protein n=1 Tax=Cudoniella acicularis TaxID=354080 RepID=A0A8H4R7C9_9HELO|nr:hypothetical protein G7Y89_g14053 [Cudoniella acicularis]
MPLWLKAPEIVISPLASYFFPTPGYTSVVVTKLSFFCVCIGGDYDSKDEESLKKVGKTKDWSGLAKRGLTGHNNDPDDLFTPSYSQEEWDRLREFNDSVDWSFFFHHGDLSSGLDNGYNAKEADASPFLQSTQNDYVSTPSGFTILDEFLLNDPMDFRYADTETGSTITPVLQPSPESQSNRSGSCSTPETAEIKHAPIASSTESPVYQCPRCSQTRKSKGELNRHINTHNRPFKCHCGESRATRTDLKRHQVKHEKTQDDLRYIPMDTNDSQSALNRLDKQHNTAWFWDPAFSGVDVPADSRPRNITSPSNSSQDHTEPHESDLDSFTGTFGYMTNGFCTPYDKVQRPENPWNGAELEYVYPRYLATRDFTLAVAPNEEGMLERLRHLSDLNNSLFGLFERKQKSLPNSDNISSLAQFRESVNNIVQGYPASHDRPCLLQKFWFRHTDSKDPQDQTRIQDLQWINLGIPREHLPPRKWSYRCQTFVYHTVQHLYFGSEIPPSREVHLNIRRYWAISSSKQPYLSFVSDELIFRRGTEDV